MKLFVFKFLFIFISMIPLLNASKIDEMSLEEKVGQILMVHFRGEFANKEAERLVNNIHVGSFIFYKWANGLQSPDQVRQLSASLQKLARNSSTSIPLIIAVDQEGGIVERLSEGFTLFPGNRALGMTKEPLLAEKSAFIMGQELFDVGINMNLAPVVDINCNPRNPIIGIRAYGDTADCVVPFAKMALQGFHKAGVITTLKHFPGHGDVEIDSHENLPFLSKSLEELKLLELLPFTELHSLTDTIMTGHIRLNEVDSEHCATLSKKIVGILRDEIGFNGVIISDSLVMSSIIQEADIVDEAAIKALEAGCDILMLGGMNLNGTYEKELNTEDVQRIHRNIVKAVQSGRISEKRLNEAVERILILKDKYIQLDSYNEPKGRSSLINQEGQSLSLKIASLALKVIVKDGHDNFGLSGKKVFLYTPEPLKSTLLKSELKNLGKLFFFDINPTQQEQQNLLRRSEEADVIIVCAYNAWKNGNQEVLINTLIESPKLVIIICVKDPLDVTLFPTAALILQTFSPSVPSLTAAYNYLQPLIAP